MASFTESAAILSKRKKIQEEFRKEIEDKEYIIATYGEDAEEYMEAKLDLGEKGGELNKQIGLRCGFGELRTVLNDCEAARYWKLGREIERGDEVGDQLPAIQEEDGGYLRAAISDVLGDDGGQSPTPSKQETDTETSDGVELGGVGDNRHRRNGRCSWGRTS